MLFLLTTGHSVYTNYQQALILKQQENLTKANSELLQNKLELFEKNCFLIKYDARQDAKCIKTLGKISTLLDQTPTNTTKQAELWELGRLYLSSLWLSEYNPQLNDRLVYQLNSFYNYTLGRDMLYPTPNADKNFREFLQKQYREKLRRL